MSMRGGNIGYRTATSQVPPEGGEYDEGGSNCAWRSRARVPERQQGVCDGEGQEGEEDGTRDESLADIVQAWMAGSENVRSRLS